MRHLLARSIIALGVAASLLPGLAQAADWPAAKPITLVIPFPPGGSADVIGRLFATELGERLKQSVLVDNKPGANTGIGASTVARARPDGYTFMLTGAPTFTSNSLLYPNLGYDPIKSFSYVAVAGSAPFVILSNGKAGLKNVADVITKSQQQPLSFGSFGTGSTPHLAGESFAARGGAQLVHVPYKGSAPAMTDLIGNQIPLSIDTLVAALPHIRGGKVTAIALTSAEPSPLLPDVPTVAQSDPQHFKGFVFQTWYGLVAPHDTPDAIVEKMAGTVQEMLQKPQVQERMRELGFTPYFEAGPAFLERVQSELKRNAAIIKDAKITVE